MTCPSPFYNDMKWFQEFDLTSDIHHLHIVMSKIEKVPRGIRGEKSSKDMASSRNLVSTIGALASPKMDQSTSWNLEVYWLTLPLVLGLV